MKMPLSFLCENLFTLQEVDVQNPHDVHRLPLTSKFHDKYVPKSVVSKLTGSTTEFHTAQGVSPPFESITNPRNYTMWKQPGLSAGGVQIDGNAVGGAAKNQGAFVPASIIWDTGVSGTGVSWINVSLSRQ